MNKHIVPRVIRLKNAHEYLGMCINVFNKEVRPFIQEFTIGKNGVGFDRLDLDAWLDHYKHRAERPKPNRSTNLWDAKERQASTKEATTGILIKKSTEEDCMKALEQAISAKRRSI